MSEDGKWWSWLKPERKPNELAREFGCHATSISAWARQAKADELGGGRADAPLTTAERQELSQLHKKLDQVTRERDIFWQRLRPGLPTRTAG